VVARHVDARFEPGEPTLDGKRLAGVQQPLEVLLRCSVRPHRAEFDVANVAACLGAGAAMADCKRLKAIPAREQDRFPQRLRRDGVDLRAQVEARIDGIAQSAAIAQEREVRRVGRDREARDRRAIAVKRVDAVSVSGDDLRIAIAVEVADGGRREAAVAGRNAADGERARGVSRRTYRRRRLASCSNQSAANDCWRV